MPSEGEGMRTCSEASVSTARIAGTPTELRIGNRLEELERASAWLAQFAEGRALPAETLFRLDLGLTEALTNIVAYAYTDASDHEIRIRLQDNGDSVRLEVEDDGRAFDPLQAERPLLPTSLQEAPIGGLGIHLIRSMLDECHYRREAGKNRLTMVARPHEADASGC